MYPVRYKMNRLEVIISENKSGLNRLKYFDIIIVPLWIFRGVFSSYQIWLVLPSVAEIILKWALANAIFFVNTHA